MAERDTHEHAEPSFRERLLNLRNLDPPLRLLTGLAFVQVIATALLLLMHPVADLTIFGADFPLGTLKTPTLNYVLSCSFLLIAATLFVAGLMRADVRGSAAVAAVLGVSYLVALSALPMPAAAAIMHAVDIGLVVLIGHAICMTFLLLAPSKFAPADTVQEVQKLPKWLLVIFLGGILFIGLIILGFPGHFASVLLVLRIPVLALFCMAAVDWAELLDAFANSATTRWGAKRKSLVLAGGCVSALSAVLIGLIFWHLPYTQNQILLAVTLSLLSIGALALLVRFSDFHTTGRPALPWAGIVLIILAYTLASLFTLKFPSAGWIVIVAVWLTTIVLFCVFTRKAGLSQLAPVLLFGILSGLFWTFWILLGSNALLHGGLGLVSLILVTLATLLTLMLVAARHSGAEILLIKLRLFIVLSVCLWGLHALFWFYDRILSYSELALVEAAVVAIAVGSEIFLSGHHVTNLNTPWFPRQSRVALFFSFVSFTLATVLLMSPLQGASEHLAVLKTTNNPEFMVWFGMFIYAPALLGTIFIVRIRQRDQPAASFSEEASLASD